MELVDAHCHLQDARLRPDLDGVLARAASAGVRGLVCCGSSEADWGEVAALAERHPAILPSFGLHPWYVRQRSSDWLETLGRWLERFPGAGVGEIGLDHALKERDDADQLQVFVRQLALAKTLGRPASIHCRRAWGALLEALQAVGDLPAGFMVHAYSGAPELVAPLTAAGGYLSFAGRVTFSGNTRGRRSLLAVPADRLLVETDAPDLTPMLAGVAPNRESVNEPANLAVVLATVAELRGQTLQAVAAQTAANARRLFGGWNVRHSSLPSPATVPSLQRSASVTRGGR